MKIDKTVSLLTNKYEARAYIFFLIWEQMRHQEDIDDIQARIEEVQQKWGLSA